jgi:hypothetical protein
LFCPVEEGKKKKKRSNIGSTNEAGDIVKHSVQKEVVMAHTSHDIFTSLLLSSALMID